MQFLGAQVSVTYEMPMSEVVLDFFDRLKSVSRGYASLDYNFERFQAADLVRLDVLINGERVDALAMIVHRDHAQQRGRAVDREDEGADSAADVRRRDPGCHRRADHRAHDRQGIAQERTAKCYGGDVTRKKKLLEKQKAGKKRMKQVGRVEIPQDAFLAVLQVGCRGR